MSKKTKRTRRIITVCTNCESKMKINGNWYTINRQQYRILKLMFKYTPVEGDCSSCKNC